MGISSALVWFHMSFPIVHMTTFGGYSSGYHAIRLMTSQGTNRPSRDTMYVHVRGDGQ